MGFPAGSAVPHIEEATDADLGSATECVFSIYGCGFLYLSLKVLNICSHKWKSSMGFYFVLLL